MILWNFVEVLGAKQGTGYFVSEDRVLTSRHVVGSRSQVKLLGNRLGEAAEWTGDVIWKGKGDFVDAAVVAVKGGPPAPPGLSGLAERPIARDGQRWSSRGRTTSALPAERLIDSMVGLGGEIFAFAEGAADFQINVSTEAKEIEDWEGISGAPVFVEGRLVGVIRWVSDSFPQSLRAVAIPTLLAEDEDFKEAIRWKKRSAKDQWAVLSRQIRKILASDETAARTLASQLEGFEGTFSGEAVHVERLGVLLCEQGSFAEALDALYRAHQKLSQARDVHRKAIQTLEVLLGWILPLHCESHFLGDVSALGGGAWLSLPIATPPVAEIYMAWLDGRSLELEPPAERTGPARPTLMISTLIESGMDTTQGVVETAIDLARQIERDPELSQFKEWAGMLARRFLSSANVAELAGAPSYVERVIGRVKAVLEFDAAYHRKRHYLIFDEKFAETHRALLRALGERLPMLRLLELTGDATREDFEFATLLPLHDLLYRIHHQDAQ